MPAAPEAPLMTSEQLREAYEALPALVPIRRRRQAPVTAVDPSPYTPQQLREAYAALPVLRCAPPTSCPCFSCSSSPWLVLDSLFLTAFSEHGANSSSY